MSALVLIADADASRAGLLGQACALRGLASRVVPNGAEALDSALTEVPDVLVASGELDLIPVRRLAEILHANPRTQHVPLLLVGAAEGEEPDADTWNGERLAAGFAPDEVAQRLEGLVARSARLDALERQAEADQEVHGRLTQIPLPDLLQLFHMNRRTGTITLRRRTADGREERGRIHLRDGEVVQAMIGPVAAEKAIFRLLAWSDGAFTFRPEPIRLSARIATPTRALLMEALRQMDEWKELGPRLPPLDAEVSLRVRRTELPSVVHPVTQEVLLLLEIYTRVRDIVDHSSSPDYQVLRTLQTLRERGLVEVRKRARNRSPDSGLFTRVQIRRLREWFAPIGREPGPLRDAKLLVAASDAEATRELLRLLAGLPGVELEGRFASGRFGANDLGRMGRLRLDAELGIELVHVPTAAMAAPLWPLAAHGALATLVLLAGDPAAAEASVAPLVEAVRARPRARLLPVRLVPAGESTADETTVPIVRPEEGAPLLLPLGAGRESTLALRSLLARLVP